jgi:uncharacterized protein YkwD
MLVSEKIAIAAHLHVLLRRKTGRVTDTEWMAQNLEYALEIVRFTRAKAVEDSHPDLNEWADKLEAAVLERTPTQRPLAQSALEMLKERKAAGAAAADRAPPSAHAPSGFGHSVPADTGFADSAPDDGKPPKPRDLGVPRYVGGIR